MNKDTHTKKCRALPAVGFVAGLSPLLRAELAAAGRFETLPVGSRAAVQGDAHHSLSLILSGKLAVSCHANGENVRLGVLSTGQTVGEMSVIDPVKASADVIVVSEPALLWTIGKARLDAFLAGHPVEGVRMIRLLAADLCRRLRKNSETMLRQAELTRSHFLDLDY